MQLHNVLMRIFRSNFFIVYIATGVAFTAQFLRDFYIFNFNGSMKIDYIFSSLYFSQALLSVLTNILLFKKFNKKSFLALNMIIIVLFYIFKVFDFNSLFIPITFTIFGILSALLGNILLFSNRIFLSRSREFFLQFGIGLVIFILNLTFINAYSLIIILLLVLNVLYFIYYDKVINYQKSLDLRASLIFSLPSFLFQIVFYYISIIHYYKQFPLALRLGVYVNAFLLAPIIVLKSLEIEILYIIKKVVIYVTIISIILLNTLIFLQYYIVLPILLGIFFACITYLLALQQFINVNPD